MSKFIDDLAKYAVKVGKEHREYYSNHGKRPLFALIGSPGSGKSTQAEMLASEIRKFDPVTIINIGQILRDSDDESVIEVMNKGELVDDEVIFGVLSKALEKAGSEYIILDGFFRRKEEAHWLLNHQKELDIDVRAVIDIELSEKEAAKRLSLRGRADDELQDIAVRLKVYSEQRKGVVSELEKHKVWLVEIDGSPSEGDVFKDIHKRLEDWEYGEHIERKGIRKEIHE